MQTHLIWSLLICSFHILDCLNQQIWPNPDPTYPVQILTAEDEERIKHVTVHFVGYSSGSYSSIKNLSKWPLSNIGANIALYSWLCQQISSHFSETKALTAPEADQKAFGFVGVNDTISTAELSAQVTARLGTLIPVIQKHQHLASTAANRWAKFLEGLEATYAIGSDDRLPNFLLGMYSSQQLHLNTLPDIVKMEELVKQNDMSSLKLDNQTLHIAHLRESILAGPISRGAEAMAISQGHRSPLFQHYSATRTLPMKQPYQINLCVPPHVHDSCNKTAIPAADSSTIPVRPQHDIPQHLQHPFHVLHDALGGRKKRDAVPHTTSTPDHTTSFVIGSRHCFWRWCRQHGADQLWQRVPDNSLRHISKRFVMMAVLAVASLVALLSSIATGAYTATEVHYIHSSLTSTDHAVQSLIHSVDILDHNVKRLDNKTDTLGQTMLDICKIIDLGSFERQIMSLDYRLTDYYESLSYTIMTNEQAFSDLRHASFPYSLADFTSLTKLYEELKVKARQIGQTLLLDGPTALFNTQTSLIFVDQQPLLISNVPTMARQEQPLEILKLSQTPLLLANTSFTYSSDYPIVVTDPARTFFQQMSTDQFKDCKHLRHQGQDYYYCQFNNGVFSKDVSSSCVMSLLTSSPSSSQTCSVTVGHLSDFVRQDSRDTFLMYAPEPDHLTIDCPGDGHRKMIPFQGFKKVKLTPGCVADTASHRVFLGLDEIHHRSLTTIARPIDPKYIFGGVTDNVPRALEIIEGHLNQLMRDNHPRRIGLGDAKDAISHALAKESLWYKLDSWKFEIILASSGLLMALTLMYFIIRFIQQHRQRRAIRRELEAEEREDPIIRNRPERDIHRALLPPGIVLPPGIRP